MIVCGTDLSFHAVAAATVAAQLAMRNGTPLELICASGRRAPALGESEFPPQPIPVGELTASSLQAEVDRLRALGVSVTGHLDPSVPDFAIARRAEGDDVELVVLGAVGRSRLERLILGSVSERVAMQSTKPVLVVRDEAPWRAWAADERPLRVLVAFDVGPSAAAALTWASDFARAGNVQLTVCWVVHPGLENRRFGAEGEGGGVELLPKTRAGLWYELQRLAGVHGALPTMELHLEPNIGRVDAALVQLARTQGHDLIVVGSNQRRGFDRLWKGSVSRGVLHDAPMSVVVVPARAPLDTTT